MKTKKIVVVFVLALSASLIYYVIDANIGSRKLNYNSSINGFVNDEITAIRIAEAIGLPIFGKPINDYKPFHAKLKNDSIWVVSGLAKKTWFKTQYGGSPVFEIQKKDGKILKVYLSR